MNNRSKVTVEFDMDQLVASYVFQTTRERIDPYGAGGIWNGFGGTRVVVNGEPVAQLLLREDEDQQVILEIIPIRDGKLYKQPVVIDIERDGIVSPRSGRTS